VDCSNGKLVGRYYAKKGGIIRMKLGDKVLVKAIYKKTGEYVDFNQLELDDDEEIIATQTVFKRVEKPHFEGIICGKRQKCVSRTFERGWFEKPIFGGSVEAGTLGIVDIDHELKTQMIDSDYTNFYLVANRLNCFYLVLLEDLERL
jgi:hypothetical protein